MCDCGIQMLKYIRTRSEAARKQAANPFIVRHFSTVAVKWRNEPMCFCRARWNAVSKTNRRRVITRDAWLIVGGRQRERYSFTLGNVPGKIFQLLASDSLPQPDATACILNLTRSYITEHAPASSGGTAIRTAMWPVKRGYAFQFFNGIKYC